MAALTERVQSLQSELDQSELRREELEAELNNTQEVRSMMCVWRSAHPLVIRFFFSKIKVKFKKNGLIFHFLLQKH